MAVAARFLTSVTMLHLVATEVVNILGCEFAADCTEGGVSCDDGRSCYSLFEQSIDGLLNPESESTNPDALLGEGKGTVCTVTLKVVGADHACDRCVGCNIERAGLRLLTDSDTRGPSGALTAVASAACAAAVVAGAVVAARRWGADLAPVRSLSYTVTPQAGVPIADGLDEPGEATPEFWAKA